MSRVIDECGRLAALRTLRILDSAPEPHLDAVCRVAAALFDVPIALVLLVDETRIRFKAKWGIKAEDVDRQGAFCDLTIEGADNTPLIIRDLLEDVRSATSPLVVGPPHARFYAGVPLALR